MPKFILISDIHASDVNPANFDAPSYVSSFNAAASGKGDPISELERLILAEDLKPNYILCAGDITNKSNPSSFTFAWNKLHDLANKCGAQLIATVGNHDVDSRFQANKYDPKGYAMSLRPSLPVAERERFLEFWAENFTVIENDDCNILVLNTAAFHGYGNEAAQELEHGRISEITIEAVKARMESIPHKPTNILLCHHHPIKGDQGDSDLVGLTRGGEKLVELLGRSLDPWIVVHGHKHVPDLLYGHGTSNAPIIIGCASFSAQVNRDSQNKNPNQVHLLVTEVEEAKNDSLTTGGQIKSWTWQPGVGWAKSQGKVGLPHHAGFGYRGSLAALAKRLVDAVTATDEKYLTWKEAAAGVPSLNWLIPDDFTNFQKILEEQSVVVLSESDGTLAQVGIKK